jgi:hypothetical protein
MKKSEFTEVGADYTDDNGVTHIDAWRSDDDDSCGETLGLVINGRVYWRNPEHCSDPLARAVVDDLLQEIKEAPTAKEFPNGFGSWMGTHYEISGIIQGQWSTCGAVPDRLIEEALEAGGSGFLYLLSEAMTDEFEKLHEGVEWEGSGSSDYYQAIESFCDRVLHESFDGHRYHEYFY